MLFTSSCKGAACVRLVNPRSQLHVLACEFLGPEHVSSGPLSARNTAVIDCARVCVLSLSNCRAGLVMHAANVDAALQMADQ